MLTLDKFEEASEKVKEVIQETKLIYSDYLSEQTGNKVYLKPEGFCFFYQYPQQLRPLFTTPPHPADETMR